jgi:hypothetical protein
VYVLAGRYTESEKVFGPSAVDVISYGAAFDLGWSFVLESGLVITLGAGMHQRWAQRELVDRTEAMDDTPRTNELIDSFTKGLAPRVLAQLGYAF